MNFSFLKLKKVYKMGLLGSVFVFIFCFFNYFNYKKTSVLTVPNEVQNEASKLDPDKRFASKWSSQVVQKDPVSDFTSQKLIEAADKVKKNEENKPIDQTNLIQLQTQTHQPPLSSVTNATTATQKSTSIVTTSGTQIDTPSTNNSGAVRL